MKRLIRSLTSNEKPGPDLFPPPLDSAKLRKSDSLSALPLPPLSPEATSPQSPHPEFTRRSRPSRLDVSFADGEKATLAVNVPAGTNTLNKRVRALSSPARGVDAVLAGSFESIFNSVGTERQETVELEPDEEGELGENVWEEKGSVQFIEVGGKKQVKAGNLNQLILHFTEAQNSTNAGAEFTDTFMITFQTFCTPYQFVRKLCERFKVPPCPPHCDEEDYAANFKLPVQLRVIKILKKWITTRYDQDLAHNPMLVDELMFFIDNVISVDHPNGAKNLMDALKNTMEQHNILVSQFNDSELDMVSSFEFSLDETAGSLQNLTNFDVRELASQMTFLDSIYFRSIRLAELVGQAWTKNKRKAPRVIRTIAHSNRISNWVTHSILSEDTAKGRAKVMTNMINLMAALKTFQNFAGIMSVLGGLNSSAITRLKYTIREVNPKVLKTQQAFSEMMRSVQSFKAYREALRSSPGPAVPFLGVTLSDLTFMEEGNPDFTPDGLINWQKRTLMAKWLSELTEAQRLSKYEIKETPMMQQFLRQLEASTQTINEHYERSLRVEPREPTGTSTSRSAKNL